MSQRTSFAQNLQKCHRDVVVLLAKLQIHAEMGLARKTKQKKKQL